MTSPNASPTPNASPSLPPRTFRAGRTYIVGPGLFVLLNLLLLVVLAVRRQIVPMPLFGALGIAFLGLFLSAVTLQITMDSDGLMQRWAWGRRRIGWHEVASIERTRRGLFLLNDKGKEIFAVSALPPADQQTIVDECVKRGRLRRDKKPPKRPVLERWVQK